MNQNEKRLGMFKNKHGQQQGFTLTEMMVTVVILGIITATALPMYARHVEKTRLTQAKSMALQLQQHAQTLKLRDGEITDDSLDELNEKAASLLADQGMSAYFGVEAVLNDGKLFIDMEPTDTSKAGLYVDAKGSAYKCADSANVGSHSGSCEPF